jgi:hypothetical protein
MLSRATIARVPVKPTSRVNVYVMLELDVLSAHACGESSTGDGRPWKIYFRDDGKCISVTTGCE